MTSSKEIVEERWSGELTDAGAFGPQVYWLAVPEIRRWFFGKLLDGTTYGSWTAWCLGRFLEGRLPVERMLSLGCGAGDLERELRAMGAFSACDAHDIAPGVIERAQELAGAAGISDINYSVLDLNRDELPRGRYDAAWFNGSLHHVEALDHALGQVRRALKPDGFLFFFEYVGPNHFDFTSRQKEVMRAMFELLPHRMRRCFTPGAPPIQASAPMPDPVEVARCDPSEAVRSSAIMATTRRHFDIVHYQAMGGTALQFLLSGIAGNFNSRDPDSLRVLDMLFKIEDTLVDIADINSDFALVVARPRH